MLSGFVWIVGAGPGDVRLLTLKAKEVLEQADVIVYDRLLTPSILSLVRPEAELIYAGKMPGGTKVSQDAINALLIAKAKEGKKVVRLKNGDPFIFGRGSEEAEALAEAGIPFEIVPGISSVFAVPAYAGIPLTDRRYASHFAVGAGKKAEGIGPNLRALSGAETVVVLMAVGELPQVVTELMAGGKAPETPAALIEWGATPRQRTLVAPLSQLPQRAQEAKMGPPAVLVVGEVVRLRERIAWFERKPLFGKRVLVTRAEEQAEAFASKLEDLGAEAIRLPLIRIVPAPDEAPLEAALTRALKGGYDWIVFTSTHGVRTFFERVQRHGKDARAFASVRFAVIGPATGDALRQWGIQPDLMPTHYTNEGLAEALQAVLDKAQARRQRAKEGQAKRFLLWRAHGAREVLAKRLHQAGALVDEVYAYRTVPNELPEEFLSAVLKEPIDVVTFTSPSAVNAFFTVLGEERARHLLTTAAIACIGPVTEAAIRQRDLEPSIIAKVHTVNGLVDALVCWAQKTR